MKKEEVSIFNTGPAEMQVVFTARPHCINLSLVGSLLRITIQPTKEYLEIVRLNHTTNHHSTLLALVLISFQVLAQSNLWDTDHKALSSSFKSIKGSLLWIFTRWSDLAGLHVQKLLRRIDATLASHPYFCRKIPSGCHASSQINILLSSPTF